MFSPGDIKIVDGVVYYGKDQSAPVALYRRARWLFQYYRFATFSPTAFLVVGILIPTRVLVQVAELSNRLFWSHLKPIVLDQCAGNCHVMAYIMIIGPVSLFSAALIAIGGVFAGIDNWRTSQTILRRGYAPYGKTAAGKPDIRDPLLLLIPGSAFLVAVVFGLGLYLYAIAGFGHLQTAGGRVLPSFLAEMFVTSVVGVAQLLVAGVTSSLATQTAIIWESLRRLVRS